jgi:hypothetical protein
LNGIQDELRSENPGWNIEILGVNDKNDASFAAWMAEGRKLPVLQDTAAADAWTAWNVTYRDVRIVDPQNRLAAVFNLTQNPLDSAANRETLKQFFRAAARVSDTDSDGLTVKARDDADQDGLDNFAEYAFGTNPVDAKSRQSTVISVVRRNHRSLLSVVQRRRAGSLLAYTGGRSSDLRAWTALGTDQPAMIRNLFDGTGSLEVTYELTDPMEPPAGFFRFDGRTNSTAGE